MGGQLTYLRKPIVTKDLCDGHVPGRARFGVCSMQGWRRSMEDAHLSVPDLTGDGRVSLFGVFDGHGGCAVAHFATKHLPDLLVGTEEFANADYQGALVASFLALDQKLLTDEGREELRKLESLEPGGAGRVPLMVPRKMWTDISKAPARTPLKNLRLDENADSSDDQVLVDPGALKEVSPESQGCTAVVALIVWEDNEASPSGARLFVANAGDSRCILSRRTEGELIEVLAMSEDHKPELPGETSRIKAGGGFIQNMPAGGSRVQGDLNLSRALGDFRHKQSKELPPEKQIVTAYPEVREHCLGLDAQMLILGCDGIWETNSNQQLAEKLKKKVCERQDGVNSKPLLSVLAAEVCDTSLCPSMTPVNNPSFDGTGCDNMTILIVEFETKDAENKQSLETGALDPFPISTAVADVLEIAATLDEPSIQERPVCAVTTSASCESTILGGGESSNASTTDSTTHENAEASKLACQSTIGERKPLAALNIEDGVHHSRLGNEEEPTEKKRKLDI